MVVISSSGLGTTQYYIGGANEIQVFGMDSHITVNFAPRALLVGVYTCL
jgi:hypothetical protein